MRREFARRFAQNLNVNSLGGNFAKWFSKIQDPANRFGKSVSTCFQDSGNTFCKNYALKKEINAWVHFKFVSRFAQI